MSFKISLYSGDEPINGTSSFCQESIDQPCVVISVTPDPIRNGMANCDDGREGRAFVFHVRMRSVEDGYYSFYAVFNLPEIEFRDNSILVVIPQISSLYLKSRCGCHHREKQLVLVRVVDVPDDIQRMYGEIWKGMVVRLDRFYGCEQFQTDWLERSLLVGCGRCIPDGEGEFVSLGRGLPPNSFSKIAQNAWSRAHRML